MLLPERNLPLLHNLASIITGHCHGASLVGLEIVMQPKRLCPLSPLGRGLHNVLLLDQRGRTGGLKSVGGGEGEGEGIESDHQWLVLLL